MPPDRLALRSALVVGIVWSSAVLPALAAAPVATQAQKPFDRKAWIGDFAFLKAELERSYSHLAWLASPQSGVKLRGLDRRAKRALDTAENDADAKAAIVDFVAGFQDGHLKPMGRAQPAAGAPVTLPATAYDELDAASGVAALGYSPSSVAFSLPFESLQGARLVSDGVTKPFRSSLLTTAKGTKLGIVRIARFREQDSPPALAERLWTARKQPGHPLDIPALKEAISVAWYEALAGQLRQFQQEKVAAVIVDLGGNGGGSDSGEWMPRLFTPGEVHSARLLMSATPAAGLYFDEHLRDLGEALKKHPQLAPAARETIQAAIAAYEQRKKSVEGRKTDMSWVWREQRPFSPDGASRLVEAGYASGQVDYLPVSLPADREWTSAVYWPARVDGLRGSWSGPVYVLTDGGTGSAAEMFTALIRDNHVARTVGSRTLGAGAGFMTDQPPIELPFSHLRFPLPNCVRLRADGTDEVAGIAPDLPVLPTAGEGGRNRAARVLEAIEADLLAAHAPDRAQRGEPPTAPAAPPATSTTGSAGPAASRSPSPSAAAPAP